MGNLPFTKDVLHFIEANANKDPYKLLLQKSPFDDISMQMIVQQIQGRKIAANKYPFLLDYDQYKYPPKVSLEQASSQQTANYKSGLMDGESFADLTGGMGIDSYLLGKKFQKCTYVEPNGHLFKSTMYNFDLLGYDQCTAINKTAEEYLSENMVQFDWIYIDPSRRIEGNRKTSINNYEPNIVELKNQLLSAGRKVMIKLSPMQDISECISVLRNVEKVWIISLKNDVKELLLQLGQSLNNNPVITAVDLANNTQKSAALYLDRTINIDCSTAKKYIYQPAAALVKSDLHNRNAKSLDLIKLHPNTQLYTSDQFVESYFGRVFEVKTIISSNKKDVKKHLPTMKANVITKNYPLNPQQLIKKLGLKEGGENYLLGFTDIEERKVLAICLRLI